jgi:hypothetical protein
MKLQKKGPLPLMSMLPIGPLSIILECTTIQKYGGYIASIPQLNMLARVCREWHSILAPPDGACTPKLTRRVTLSQPDMFRVAEVGTIARPWWRWVKAAPNVTDAGLACMVVACPDITILDLFGCNRITDTGLASLAATCPAISDLCLLHCNRITDTGLASLATGCPAITVLNLTGCCLITKDAITAWREL